MHAIGNIFHLLSTNTSPTRAEVASVKERLGRLRSEMLQVKARLQTLEEEETRHLAVLSPIRQIPIEILGEILLIATPGTCDQKAVVGVRDFCLVCKNWRDAALLMREAWNNLSFTPQDLARPGAYDGIVARLSRSGNLPKRLEFNGSLKFCDCRVGPCTTASPAFQRLLKEGPALHHLGLNLVSIHCFRRFVASLRRNPDERPSASLNRWDSLASLSIAFCDFPPRSGHHERGEDDETPNEIAGVDLRLPLSLWDDWDTNPSTSPFSSIPNTVTSFGLHLPAAMDAFALPTHAEGAILHVLPAILRNLTALTIRCDWQGPHFVNLLKECSNLEFLTMDFNFSSPGLNQSWLDRYAKSPVVLPGVRRLCVLNAESLALLNGITAPAIEELDLGMGGSWLPAEELNKTFCNTVQSFLRRSQHIDGLHSLRIYNLSLPNESLISLFAEIPSLRRLTLDTVNIDLEFTMAILGAKAMRSIPDVTLESLNMSNNPLFPCLKRLELFRVPPDYPFRYLIQILGMRQHPPFGRVVASYESRPPRSTPDAERGVAQGHTETDFDIASLRRSGLSFDILSSAQGRRV